MNISDVDLCAGCRISAGHHKYFNGEGAASAYFRGKSSAHFDTLSIVRTDPSKNGYNAGCVHVPLPLGQCDFLDYIVFKNSTATVNYICAITSVEYVNDKTTRIYWSIDYYATFIGYVQLGNCYVIRQHPKTDILGENLQYEECKVPMVSLDCPFTNLEAAVATMWNSASFHVLSNADELGNTNSAKVQAHIFQGTPSFGYYKKFGSLDEVAVWVAQYLNNGVSSTMMNQVSRLTALQKIWFAPSICGVETSAQTPTPIKCNFTPPAMPSYKWAKMYSPQFLKWTITAQTTGQKLELTLLNQNVYDPRLGMRLNASGVASIDTGKLTWDTWLYPCGFPYPQTALGLYYYGNTSRPSPDECIMQQEFPEVPLTAQFDANKRTAIGAVNDVMGELGQIIDMATSMSEGKTPSASKIVDVARGTTATVANVAGFGDKIWQQKSVNAQTSSGVNSGFFHYSYNTTSYQPNAEGVKILEGFFNRFGYAQNKFMQLELMTRSNFTYTKIAQGATFTSDLAPQIAVDAIREMLENGITLWQADIGSTNDPG